ncbi:MAG: hypothetical protein BRD26_05500 [Bacteroidetes bacterium QH_1_64_81]|nr:MAG: hypothetical protein BRD26_05500 [Bacteroidetes bacterium QH_1_64_81]
MRGADCVPPPRGHPEARNTPPPSALYAEEFIASSQTDPAPLVEIIEQDPSVSVNVLRRVNSAYYGVRREVEGIDQAVRLLGCVEISSIVLIRGVDEFQEHFSSCLIQARRTLPAPAADVVAHSWISSPLHPRRTVGIYRQA